MILAAGCASAPPARTTPVVPFERKMATILELEDQRILRVEPPPPPPAPVKGRAPAPPPAPPAMDLVALLADGEGRVRRRAALAIGRVGLREGVPPLAALLGDADAEVRQMAAFALGLIADASASPALTAALNDPAPLVRGRAAEALGQIGAKDAAAAIGQLAAEYAVHPAVTSKTPDDEQWPGEPEADAFKLALFALVRLGAYEPLAAAVIEGDRPRSTWWPVAYALQRINDPRTVPALRQLLSTPGKYTASFAARGLGASKDATVAPLLMPLLDGKRPLEVTVSAIRALAQLRAASASEALIRLAGAAATDPNVRLEAVTALGTLQSPDALPVVQDLMTDRWPAMRIAAMRAAAAIDPEIFRIVLATLEPDRDWSVRAAMASTIATLERELALTRLPEMLKDEDKRTWPAVLRALARVKAPQLPALLMDRIQEPDFVVRATVSELIGQLKPEGGAAALREAYKTALADAAYDARAAALSALAQYGAAEATPTLTEALADKDWAVRVRAAELLAKLDPASDVRAVMRPAPGGSAFDDPALIGPPYSPHVYIETAKGTIEFELAVLDAPQTSRNFIALARKGFFNGLAIHRVVPNFVVQDGDPRGDGQGGPGYTIRDELNERPFLRATVGMALSWKDTGGSQFFIVHSPAPHLDARYTAFGHVVNGMEVVDRIQQGDVIERVRVWDGEKW
jgi:cyclophilin family peptidyl-prolyl cis-trans isomerase/HEAT repeat protein